MENRLKIEDIIFDSTLKKMLINGGVITKYWLGEYVFTCLVRLPKGKWFNPDKDGKSSFAYEYMQFQTSTYNPTNETYHAVSRNGTIRQIVRVTQEDHFVSEFSAMRRAEKNK